ncbi:hypothetical protein [Pseudomonas nitroreducens]|uniref:hypothetical protein n=1 Tax=Pseudomonas nitroreducens TaxID=46680 RepID=UPI002FE14846
MNNAKLLSDQFRGLQGAIASMPDEAPIKSVCQSFLADAISTLSELHTAHPQAYEQSERLALYLASLATCLGSHYASVIHDQAEKGGENRRIANAETELYADVARAKAAALWDADSNRQEFCVTEVSNLVHDIMLREGHSRKNRDGKENLTRSAVKRWIAPFAPDYARQPGRRKASE